MLSMDRKMMLATRPGAATPSPSVDRPLTWGLSRLGWVRRLMVAAAAAMLVALAPATASAQGGPDEGGYADTDPSALTDFHDALAPHGQWMVHPTYGTVWVPNAVVVGRDFAPYRTAGRWAVTDSGDWVWVSDYEWGYIPFHYGRWVWIPETGWAWIPGREYAPAWVEWRVGEPGWDYVGWAPMGPSFIWMDGVAVGYWGFGVLPFWFVPSPWLFSPYWYDHVIWDHHRSDDIWHHTHHHGDHDGEGGHSDRHPADASASGPGTPGPAGGHSAAGASAGGSFDSREARASTGATKKPSSPTFQEARVPKASVPKDRVKEDSKALALARPTAEHAAAARARSAGGMGYAGRAGSTGRVVDIGHGAAARRPSSGYAPAQRPTDAYRPSNPPAARPAAGRPDAPAWRAPATRPDAWQPRTSPRPSTGWQAPRNTPSYSPPSHSYGTPSWGGSHSSGPSYRPSAPASSSSSRKSSGKSSSSGSSRKSSGSHSSHSHKR